MASDVLLTTLTSLLMPAVLRFFPLGVSGWGGPLLPLPCPSQREASFTFDSTVLTQLVTLSSTPREKQRLSRVSQPHAGSWVTAVPSTIDGPDALIRPQAFRIACRLRLGVSVFDDGIPCPSCMHTFLDKYGDHAICCTSTGDLIVRHNRMRDLVEKFAREGQLSPVLEKRVFWVSPLPPAVAQETSPSLFGVKGKAFVLTSLSPAP